jgi:hypothetical protein
MNLKVKSKPKFICVFLTFPFEGIHEWMLN